jgi:hypothetical protein
MKYLYLHTTKVGKGSIVYIEAHFFDGSTRHDLTLLPDLLNKDRMELGDFFDSSSSIPSKDAHNEFCKFMGKFVDKFDKDDKFMAVGINIDQQLQSLYYWFLAHQDKYFNSYFLKSGLDLSQILVLDWYENSFGEHKEEINQMSPREMVHKFILARCPEDAENTDLTLTEQYRYVFLKSYHQGRGFGEF